MAAEGPEQLLGAMAHQKQAGHEVQKEKSELHGNLSY
jgi:hypothetical protein